MSTAKSNTMLIFSILHASPPIVKFNLGVASENSNLNKYFFLWYFYEHVFPLIYTY